MYIWISWDLWLSFFYFSLIVLFIILGWIDSTSPEGIEVLLMCCENFLSYSCKMCFTIVSIMKKCIHVMPFCFREKMNKVVLSLMLVALLATYTSAAKYCGNALVAKIQSVCHYYSKKSMFDALDTGMSFSSICLAQNCLSLSCFCIMW